MSVVIKSNKFWSDRNKQANRMSLSHRKKGYHNVYKNATGLSNTEIILSRILAKFSWRLIFCKNSADIRLSQFFCWRWIHVRQIPQIFGSLHGNVLCEGTRRYETALNESSQFGKSAESSKTNLSNSFRLLWVSICGWL